MERSIPIIDLFAGPGGLGEGFARFGPEDGLFGSPFKIRLSVEMDSFAHQTLLLRSFYRQFLRHEIPEDYYSYIKGDRSREDLFARHSDAYNLAKQEALHRELGREDHDPEIYAAIEHAVNEYSDHPWVLIGGPPCQAYSMIGRARRRVNGIGKEAHEQDKRNFLYLEYLRIIASFRPAVFVMENVTGILSSSVRGENIFTRIRSDLRRPLETLKSEYPAISVPDELEYRIYSLVVASDSPDELKPEDYIIKCEEYGVPQARHRVILLGVRSDLAVHPGVLKPQKAPKVSEVIQDLPPLRCALSREVDDEAVWKAIIREANVSSWIKELETSHPKLSERLPELATELEQAVCAVRDGLHTGRPYLPRYRSPERLKEWFLDPRLQGVCNHEARAHMSSDIHRYLYAACYARVYGQSPLMCDFPEALLPEHQNVQRAISGDVFDDRFHVQQPDRPASTITCHISKDGHYNIHFDPVQCRSLTVREAARLQTFPDNYYFEGSRTQQFRQVGNAVPPWLAYQIADVVYNLIERSHETC